MQNEKIRKLKSLSTLLDSQFRGPFGWRFGLDAILGLVPVVGDFATTAVSIFILSQAGKLGASPSTIARMAINVAIENIVDMVPLLGNIFDFFWKANNRNMRILEAHVQNPGKTTAQSRFTVGVVIFCLLALLVGTGYTALIIFEWLFQLFSSSYQQWSI